MNNQTFLEISFCVVCFFTWNSLTFNYFAEVYGQNTQKQGNSFN